MNKDEVDAAALVSEMHRQNLTCKEALKAIQIYANDKMFQDELDKVYGNDLLIEDEWDNWHPNDSI